MPVLTPMSEVAKVDVDKLVRIFENHAGGKGMLLGGVPGVAPGISSLLAAEL